MHFMRLNPAPFGLIRDGRKSIELRLYDEKRRKIQIGDGILFENTEAPELLLARVTGLRVFASFDDLYQALPLEACGYTEADVDAASPADMDAYYSKEAQQRFGVEAGTFRSCGPGREAVEASRRGAGGGVFGFAGTRGRGAVPCPAERRSRGLCPLPAAP